MRVPNSAHASRPWRIHALTRDFRLEDVWELPTPGGAGDFPRLVRMLASYDPAASSSRAVRTLFAIRWKMGALLGWDRLDSPPGQQPHELPFTSLYQTQNEWAAEIVNSTVHGIVHVGWVPDESGVYRGQLAIYVKRNGLLGTAYMAAITPFRHLIVYPQTLREIERIWRADSVRSGSRERAQAK